MSKLILKNRLDNKKLILDFNYTPDINKEDAEKIVEEFHQQNPDMHFAISIISSMILIQHAHLELNDIEKTANNLTHAISVLMVAFPDIFDNEIEYSYHNGHMIELHSGGILDKYIAYEIIARTRRN